MFGSEVQLALGPRLHVGYGWAKDAFFTNDDSEHLVVMGALAGTTHFGLDRDVAGPPTRSASRAISVFASASTTRSESRASPIVLLPSRCESG